MASSDLPKVLYFDGVNGVVLEDDDYGYTLTAEFD